MGFKTLAPVVALAIVVAQPVTATAEVAAGEFGVKKSIGTRE
jgi:hypothetical protein